MGLVEEIIEHASVKNVSAFLGFAGALYVVLGWIDKTIRYRRLPGAAAFKIPSRLPFGKSRHA